MKDILKSFALGVVAAVGFFTAISFTADAEDMAAEAEQAEYAAYLEGLQEGAKQASKSSKSCLFTEYVK